MASRAKWWPEPFSYDYTYLNSLEYHGDSEIGQVFKTLGQEARSIFSNELSQFVPSNLNGQLKESNASEILNMQASRERQKERAFLIKIGLLEEADSAQDAGRILLKFNQLYNNRQNFIGELNKIISPEAGHQLDYTHIMKVFDSYLSTALNEWWRNGGYKNFSNGNKNKISEQQIRNIVSKALDKTLDAEDKLSGEQIYSDTKQLLKDTPERKQLIQELASLYGSSIVKAIDNRKTKKGKRGTGIQLKENINNAQSLSGYAFEYFNAAVLGAISKSNSKIKQKNGVEMQIKLKPSQVKHSGKLNQMKSDILVLYDCDVKVDFQKIFNPDQDKESTVAKNIEGMKELHQALAGLSGEYTLVEVSDKNYNAHSQTWQGFHAQQNTSLKHFEEILQTAGFQQNKLQSLIFVMANMGTGTIGMDASQRDLGYYLSTLIGYFLFEDANFSIEGNQPNAIHLFNLGGIYVPLSCFLEAASKAFESVETYKALADIHFTPAAAHEAQANSEADWQRVRNRQLDKGRISMYFFRDFVQYLRNTLNNDILKEWK